MGRSGGPSKGCRICRQRKIKCDEGRPHCTQCKSTGRVCPGPITGIVVSDMTLKAGRKTPHKSTSRSLSLIRSGRIDKAPSQPEPKPAETEASHEDQNLGVSVTRSNQSTWSPEPVKSNALSIEKLGTTLDPFESLPLRVHFSNLKLMEYCMHCMTNSFVVLGPGDPMKDIWLPMIFSDKLLLQCTLFTSSIHMSAIYGIESMDNVDVVIHKAETLSLLMKRLGDPRHAVNDQSVTAVARFLGQVIFCKHVPETKLHMDGLERMLAFNPYFKPSDQVREMLFWTDLTAAALCHAPPRQLTKRPNIRLYGSPILLAPRSTLGAVCRGFQKILAQYSIFSEITDILHDLRCLTTVAQYSDCRAHSEMPIFNDLCLGVSARLGNLVESERCEVFECCRLAAMVFVDVVLLHETSNTLALAAGIKGTLAEANIDEMIQQMPELMTWILYMGCAAALETCTKPWFMRHFAQAASFLGLQHFETMRKVLIEFLWLEDVSSQHLKLIWSELQEKS